MIDRIWDFLEDVAFPFVDEMADECGGRPVLAGLGVLLVGMTVFVGIWR